MPTSPHRRRSRSSIPPASGSPVRWRRNGSPNKARRSTGPISGCHIVAGMDFAMSAKAQDYHKRLTAFMVEHVFPAEAAYHRYREEAGPDDHTVPPVVEELK